MPKAKQPKASEIIEEATEVVAPQPSPKPEAKDKPQSDSKSIPELMKKMIITHS